MNFLNAWREQMAFPLYLIILMATVTFTGETKTYTVKKIQNGELIVTGKGDSPSWKKGPELSEFEYPWEGKKSTTTSFKALHDSEWFYCLFEVGDPEVRVYVVNNNKLEVVNSDRVEIFFKKDDRLLPYYCLELDPNSRVMDYEAKYHRNFNPDWSWPSGQLNVKSSRTKEGYKVEVAISKQSLRQLGLLQGNILQAGLYRAECVSLEGDQATMSWISWIKPNSEAPDFHISSSFGSLILEE